eukprot:g6236.t1
MNSAYSDSSSNGYSDYGYSGYSYYSAYEYSQDEDESESETDEDEMALRVREAEEKAAYQQLLKELAEERAQVKKKMLAAKAEREKKEEEKDKLNQGKQVESKRIAPSSEEKKVIDDSDKNNPVSKENETSDAISLHKEMSQRLLLIDKERELAAIKIQSLERSRKCRAELKKRRKEKKLLKKMRNDAAKKLQRLERGRQGRSFAKKKKMIKKEIEFLRRKEREAAITIQKLERGRRQRLHNAMMKKVRNEEIQWEAAILIQARQRGIMARAYIKTIKRKQNAKKKLQKLLKGTKIKKNVILKIENFNEKIKDKAAIKIQSMQRGRNIRRLVKGKKIMEKATIKIQSRYRGTLTRREDRFKAHFNPFRSHSHISQLSKFEWFTEQNAHPNPEGNYIEISILNIAPITEKTFSNDHDEILNRMYYLGKEKFWLRLTLSNFDSDVIYHLSSSKTKRDWGQLEKEKREKIGSAVTGNIKIENFESINENIVLKINPLLHHPEILCLLGRGDTIWAGTLFSVTGACSYGNFYRLKTQKDKHYREHLLGLNYQRTIAKGTPNGDSISIGIDFRKLNFRRLNLNDKHKILCCRIIAVSPIFDVNEDEIENFEMWWNQIHPRRKLILYNDEKNSKAMSSTIDVFCHLENSDEFRIQDNLFNGVKLVGAFSYINDERKKEVYSKVENSYDEHTQILRRLQRLGRRHHLKNVKQRFIQKVIAMFQICLPKKQTCTIGYRKVPMLLSEKAYFNLQSGEYSKLTNDFRYGKSQIETVSVSAVRVLSDHQRLTNLLQTFDPENFAKISTHSSNVTSPSSCAETLLRLFDSRRDTLFKEIFRAGRDGHELSDPRFWKKLEERNGVAICRSTTEELENFIHFTSDIRSLQKMAKRLKRTLSVTIQCVTDNFHALIERNKMNGTAIVTKVNYSWYEKGIRTGMAVKQVGRVITMNMEYRNIRNCL